MDISIEWILTTGNQKDILFLTFGPKLKSIKLRHVVLV